MNITTGDAVTAEQVAHIENLDKLWDMLNDCVSAGRLSEADIPEDYQALMQQMESCNESTWKLA